MTQDEQGYNGWANYETWVTALHIDNDEYTYNASRELVRDLIADEDEENPIRTYEAAEVLKSFVEEAFIDDQKVGGLAADLLGAALSEVDWHEIAVNYLDEVRAEMVAS